MQNTTAATRALPGERPTHRRRFAGHILESFLFTVTLGFGWLIWFAFLAPNGQPPAKALLKLYVYDFETGETPPARRMWGREVGVKYILPALTGFLALLLPSPLGGLMLLVLQVKGFAFVIVLFNKDRRAFWDYQVGTVVRHVPEDEKLPAPEEPEAFAIA